MGAGYWALHVVLALVFLAHGFMFVAQPEPVRERLANEPLSSPQFRLLGIAEIAAAVVLVVVPLLDGRLLGLLAAATIGLLLVIVPAIVLHLRRRESGATVFTVVLFVALAVALGGALTR